MDQVWPKLYVGDKLDAVSAEALRAAGITAVLNVAQEVMEAPPRSIRSLKVGLRDEPSEDRYMIKLAANTLRGLLGGAETVLVHCAAGMSRSPYVAAMAISQIDGYGFDVAWSRVRRYRTVVLPVSNLVKEG